MLQCAGLRYTQERPDVRYCLVAVDFLPAAVIRASMLRLCAEFAHGALLSWLDVLRHPSVLRHLMCGRPLYASPAW